MIDSTSSDHATEEDQRTYGEEEILNLVHVPTMTGICNKRAGIDSRREDRKGRWADSSIL